MLDCICCIGKFRNIPKHFEKSNEFDGTIEPSDYHDLVYSFLDEWEEGEDPNDLYLTGDSDRQFAVALLHRLYAHFDHLDAGVVDAPEIVAVSEGCSMQVGTTRNLEYRSQYRPQYTKTVSLCCIDPSNVVDLFFC